MSAAKPRPNSAFAAGWLLLLLFAFPFLGEAETIQNPSDEAGSPPSFPIAGKPPLTLAMVDQATGLLERILDAKLTAEQRTQFEDFLVASWRYERETEMQSAVQAVQLADELNRKTPLVREMYLRMLRPRFLAQLRAQPTSDVSRWILDVYDAVHGNARTRSS